MPPAARPARAALSLPGNNREVLRLVGVGPVGPEREVRRACRCPSPMQCSAPTAATSPSRTRSSPTGTLRRIVGYARPYKWLVIGFLITLVIDAVLVVAQPLLFRRIIDQGVTPGDSAVVTQTAILIGLLAVFSAGLTLLGRWYSSRIGEGLIYDLRTQVYDHVQRMPVAFFTRAQTGALVSRLNNDVIGAQQAFTSTLSGVVGNAISLVAVVIAMLALSWQITRGLAAAAAGVPRPRALHGSHAAGHDPRADAAQRRDVHADDRALQRRRRPAGQAVRPPGRGGGRVLRRVRTGARHRRHASRWPTASSSPPSCWWPRIATAHRLRRRRQPGHHRSAHGRHAARPGRPARPALRTRSPRCRTCASTS